MSKCVCKIFVTWNEFLSLETNYQHTIHNLKFTVDRSLGIQQIVYYTGCTVLLPNANFYMFMRSKILNFIAFCPIYDLSDKNFTYPHTPVILTSQRCCDIVEAVWNRRRGCLMTINPTNLDTDVLL